MNDLASHSSQSIKLKKLEKAWDNTINSGQESRRLAQMTQDIKYFIVRSMSDPSENRRITESLQRDRQHSSSDTFSTIASTLGFRHHEGTDHNLELRVIKVIMIREGILMSLKFAADIAEKQGTLEGNNLLELMSQLRESTLNYLEYLCLWRQSAQSETGEMQPRAFMWENQNYTMKLITDLDFLGENPAVIENLNLSQEQLRSNPLMLSSNLEDFNTWMAPEERASIDVNGNTSTPEFQTRLRLRYAERILLQEMEMYSFEGSQVFMTQERAGQGNPDQMMIMNQPNPQSQNVMVGSNVLENEYDYDPNMAMDDNPEFAAMLKQHQLQQDQNPESALYFSSDRRVKTTEGSNRTSNFSQPQSRASTITNGFLSAPNTSHGSRGQSHQGAGIPISSGGGMVPLEYGHDFFTGHWGDGNSSDAFPFFPEGSYLPGEHSQLPPMQPNHDMGTRLDDDEDGEDEVLYRENADVPYFESYTPMNDSYHYAQQRQGPRDQEIDDNSVRSVESVSEVDMRVLSGLFVPPKVVNLAGAVAVILTSKGNEIPMDASWSSFLRLMKRPGFLEGMNILNPKRVPHFKLLAVQPLLDQIFYDEQANHQEYSRKQMSFQELIAVAKLMNWVRQFSETESKSPEEKKSIKKSKKKKTLVSPFKAPPGSLTSLNDSKQGGSQAGGGSVHSGSRKRSVSPLQMSSSEQNLKAKEKMKSSRVKEKTALVQLARKQMEEKEKKEKEAADKKAGKGKLPGSGKGKKQAIPKVQLDIVPFHRETFDNLYIHPVLVVLLTSPDALDIAPPKPENSDDERGKEEKQANEEDGIGSLKYVVPAIPKTSVEQTRLVIKAHDSTDSKEAMTYINMREHQLFVQDLPEKINAPEEEVQMFFQPFNLRWWAENIGKVIVINASGGAGVKALKISISKQKIEEHVRTQIGNLHRLPLGPAGRRLSMVASRRNSIAPGSAGSTHSSASQNRGTPTAVVIEKTKQLSSSTTSSSTTSKDTTAVSSKDSKDTSTLKQEKEVAHEEAKESSKPAGPVEKQEVVKDKVVEIEDEVVEDQYHDDFASVPATAAVLPKSDNQNNSHENLAAPPVHAEESLGYGDDFEDSSKPVTAVASMKEKSVDYLEDGFEGDNHESSSARSAPPASFESAVGSEDDHHLVMGSVLGHEPDYTLDDDSIEDNFPELKPPSRIASTRTSLDFDAMQRQAAANSKKENPISESVEPKESLYGSDFEHAEEGSVELQPASPLQTTKNTSGVPDDVDNSLVFEVSANTVTVPANGSNKIIASAEEEEEEDDGIYDDDLSETAQAPMERSRSMSAASMRMSSSFNHGTSNPPSSSKGLAPVSTVLEPDAEDDHSLYNIDDDDV